jgi:Cu2+-exporting ATPase
VKPLVLALERQASHPIARGFVEAWPALEAPAAGDVAQTPGGGIEGLVSGHRVVVGAPVFVCGRLGAHRRSLWSHDFTLTPVLIAVDGRIVARAGFGDPLRADAAAAIHELRALGWRVRLLSGDHPAVVEGVGQRLGLSAADCRGGASPEDKTRAVEEAALHGPVVMVGDGVNDAAAIARATAGVGVRGGMEACLSAADVYLLRPGLAPLVDLVHGARRTLGVIRRNILFSLVYNLAAATLAVAGVINPLLAAILMPASSLTVLLVARLGRTFQEAR